MRADNGNRTRIGSLEDCGLTFRRYPRSPARRARCRVVEADGNRTHILRVQTGCSPVELQSHIDAISTYRDTRHSTRAGRERIETEGPRRPKAEVPLSLRDLRSRPVTMTLRPNENGDKIVKRGSFP